MRKWSKLPPRVPPVNRMSELLHKYSKPDICYELLTGNFKKVTKDVGTQSPQPKDRVPFHGTPSGDSTEDEMPVRRNARRVGKEAAAKSSLERTGIRPRKEVERFVVPPAARAAPKRTSRN